MVSVSFKKGFSVAERNKKNNNLVSHIPTARVCPRAAATIRAEHPQSSTALTGAPWARTSWSPATFPEYAAACSGVLNTSNMHVRIPHEQIYSWLTKEKILFGL